MLVLLNLTFLMVRLFHVLSNRKEPNYAIVFDYFLFPFFFLFNVIGFGVLFKIGCFI